MIAPVPRPARPPWLRRIAAVLVVAVIAQASPGRHALAAPPPGARPLDVNLPEAIRDATEAIALANQRYLGPALAERGLESLGAVVHGVVVGAALSSVLTGVTLYYGLSIRLTVLFLEWLGVGSLTLFTNQQVEQIAAAFHPFLATVADAHGDRTRIDVAARQYAEAVAMVCGVAGEALLLLAAARGLDHVLRALEGTRLGMTLGRERLRAWIEALRRRGASTGRGGASRPSASTASREPPPGRLPPDEDLTGGAILRRAAPLPKVTIGRAPALGPANVELVIGRLRAEGRISTEGITLVRRAAANKTEKWGLPDMLRGDVSHVLRGQNLPASFPVIDRAVRGIGNIAQEVVSLKSHQPYAESLQRPGGFLKALQGEIDALARFTVEQISGVRVEAGPGTRRILEIEVPPDTIAAELIGRPRGDPILREQFRSEATSAAAYAEAKGVELRFQEAIRE